MPSVWESPAALEEGLAAALFMFLYHAKYGRNYFMRSMDDPVVELELKDIDVPAGDSMSRNLLVIWWVYINRVWRSFKRHARKLE
jgi:hypothetical protein